MSEGADEFPSDDLLSWAEKQPAKDKEFDEKYAKGMKEARDAREKDQLKKASQREQRKKEMDYHWYHGKGNREPGFGQLPGGLGTGKRK